MPTRSSVVQPMDPLYIMSFLSKKKIDKDTIDRMIKALEKYHKACEKAAKILDVELKEISKKSVAVKKTSTKK